MQHVEYIEWNGELLAYLIRAGAAAEKTSFLTPPKASAQVGFVVHPAGSQIAPHIHLPFERRVIGTFEVLVVRQGRCEVDIYNPVREFVATRELREGDVMLIAEGGHGFRMLEDTILLEVKQGPYLGLGEKEQF
jgi:hypothetical protein